MEDVLEVYQRPHDPACPVVCLDETTKQLIAETRVLIAAKPGRAAGAVFAYITGSSLFFINALGLSPYQYGLIFGTSSLSVMIGTLVNKRLDRWGVSPSQMIAIGLALSTVLATSLLVMAV